MEDNIPKRLKNWPFLEGEKAILHWISTPFILNNKVMLNTYFKEVREENKDDSESQDDKPLKEEKVLVDWGTLPALAIQHTYVDGKIFEAIEPEYCDTVEITIYPDEVTYYEKEWKINKTDNDISRSFIVKYNGKNYVLPIIEVVRSILAPNRFLLYRLFEPNSFPLYFMKTIEANKIHFDFTSLYNFKYTKKDFVFQLAYLLSNEGLLNMYNKICWNHPKINLKMDWEITDPITIQALVKKTNDRFTILKITKVLEKVLPFDEISIEHPEFRKSENSDESKRYTIHKKKKSEEEKEQNELDIDEQADGTKDNFDFVGMNNQIHEYTKNPKIIKQVDSTNKKRKYEDENTRKIYLDDSSLRSTADVGGLDTLKGIESIPLSSVQLQGELEEFVEVLRVLENDLYVQSINVIHGKLTDISTSKKFAYLDDLTTSRRYIIGEVLLYTGELVSIIEVERESRALSTLIIYMDNDIDKSKLYCQILKELIMRHGNWDREFFGVQKIKYSTLKHGNRDLECRLNNINKKIYYAQ